MTKKRKRAPVAGHPSIFKVKSGFQVDLYLKTPGSRKYNRRIRKTFRSLPEAIAFKEQTKAKNTLGIIPEREATLGDAARIRLSIAAGNRSINGTKRSVNLILDHFGSDTPIAGIDEPALLTWVELLRNNTHNGQPWKPKTVWNYYRELRVLLNLAYKRGWIKIVPSINIKPQCGRRKPVPLTDYLQAIEELPGAPEPDRGMMLMALFTGQRLGDLQKMRWSQVQDGVIYYRSSKTSNERLGIPNPPAELMKELNGLGDPRDEPEALIFAKPGSARPYCHSAIRDRLTRACEKAGVPRFTPHQIRHRATTTGLEHSDPTLVQNWMGWLNPEMILTTYGHNGNRLGKLMEDMQAEIRELRSQLRQKEVAVPANVIPFQTAKSQ